MKVAAFNMKNLGNKKVSNNFVSEKLIKIINRYTMIVILEVVDKSGKAMKMLLDKLNDAADHHYVMVCSSSLGRDSYKEQFVCFYRRDEVKRTDQYQYEDNQAGDEDAFAREPFILRFSCPETVVKDLVLIPVHTKPEDSMKELDELYDVVMAVRRKWSTDNIMILGDFNADGRYLSGKKKKSIRISSEPFHWLIDDSVDTTTSDRNDNTYDRIVVYGDDMLDAIVPGSAKPFNFQKAFRLSNEKALSISDHYPVEVELKSAPTQKKKKAAPKKAGAQRTPVARKRKQQPAAATKTATKRRR